MRNMCECSVNGQRVADQSIRPPVPCTQRWGWSTASRPSKIPLAAKAATDSGLNLEDIGLNRVWRTPIIAARVNPCGFTIWLRSKTRRAKRERPMQLGFKRLRSGVASRCTRVANLDAIFNNLAGLRRGEIKAYCTRRTSHAS